MPDTQTRSPETQASIEVVQRLYDAAVGGDMDTVLDSLTEDFVLEEPQFLPYGGVYEGRQGFAELIQKALTQLDVQKMSIDRFVADGEWVIGIIRMPLVGSGEEILLAEESKVRDGK